MPDVNVYTRIPEDLDTELEITRARRRISKPKAIREAIESWLKSEKSTDGRIPSRALVQGVSTRVTPGASETLDTLTSSEQDAVQLLLTILRHGSDTVKKAIVWNLHGFAEPIKPKGSQGDSAESARGVEFSEAIKRVIRAAEEVGVAETERRKWLDDLRRIEESFGQVRGTPKGDGKAHRKRGG